VYRDAQHGAVRDGKLQQGREEMKYSSRVRPLSACNPSEEGVNNLKIVKVAALAALSIAVLFGAGTPASAWTPPIGIPDPGFGITDVAPASTHYVDNSKACNDANNGGFGSTAAPRCTIPTTLAAGSVVEVHGGPYIYLMSCWDAFLASGTALNPVFVRGIADASGNKPVIKGNNLTSGSCFQTHGTYYIVEGFRFNDGTRMNARIGGSYAVYRNNEFVNYQTIPDQFGRQSGAALGPAYTNFGSGFMQAGGDHWIVYNNVFRDNGNYLSTVDNKMQGIKFSGETGAPGTAYVWILDNIFYHNGQAMQHGDDCVGAIVNGFCQADLPAFPHHFYIGGNTIHDNREVGIALKMIRDVVISQNDIYNHKDLPIGTDCSASPTVSSINLRAASDNVWVLFNKVHDSSIGIRSNGQTEAVTGPTPVFPKVYVIGNLLYNIWGTNATTGANCFPANPKDLWGGGAGIIGWDNYQAYAVDNTIVNSDKGISFISSGSYEVTGNLIKNTGDPMNHVPVQQGVTNKFDYNFYDATARLAYDSSTPIMSLSQVQAYGQELHSRQGSALLDTNYKPTSGSPAVDVSIRSGVYDTFFSLYGIGIAKDVQGVTRPQGLAWDIGAYELGGQAGSSPPAPTGLSVR
jgi:hypothetical protein